VLLLNLILYNSRTVEKVLLNDHLKGQTGSLKVLDFFVLSLCYEDQVNITPFNRICYDSAFHVGRRTNFQSSNLVALRMKMLAVRTSETRNYHLAQVSNVS
jgi:hypothetical protein